MATTNDSAKHVVELYLPDESASSVLASWTLPVPPPETIGASQCLSLHNLRIIDVRVHIKRVLKVLHKVKLCGMKALSKKILN